jgi:feruloyl esterase
VVEWVEQGRVPQSLLGTKFVNDTADLGISFQRTHCL